MGKEFQEHLKRVEMEEKRRKRAIYVKKKLAKEKAAYSIMKEKAEEEQRIRLLREQEEAQKKAELNQKRQELLKRKIQTRNQGLEKQYGFIPNTSDSYQWGD